MFRFKPKAGFTLIELLVVISIIALLLGIAMPSLRKAREYAKTVRCAANLKGIGVGWVIYCDHYPNTLPMAVGMPSVPSANQTTIMGVLAQDVADVKAYRCPADDQNNFTQTGTSYEYLPATAIAINPQYAGVLAQLGKQRGDTVPIIADAEPYHPMPASSVFEPRQTMYYDGHVDWLQVDTQAASQ